MVLALAACGDPADEPTVIPWAWHRSEDLTFLSPATPIAAWFATITVAHGNLDVVRRTQPLHYHVRAPLIAVFRLESTEPFDNATRQRIARTIGEIGETVDAGEIQLDFDARRSQRQSYRRLIEAIRRTTELPVSMTALASWCLDDDWLSGLPVDDVVPMLYRMGAEGESIRARLAAANRPALGPHCRSSVGYITDEPVVAVAAPKRAFLFSDTPWTARAFYDFKDHVLDRLKPLD